LWGNAELYRTPDDPAPLRAYDYPDADRLLHANALYAAPVLGEGDGGRIEVRLGGNLEWSRHCVGSNLLPYWTAVRVWIDPEDLVEVLDEEVVVDHEDGTGVRLMPGTPLVGDRAWLDGQLVPVPAGAIRSKTYPGDAPRLDPMEMAHSIPWDSPGTLGGEPYAVRRPDYQYGDELWISWASPTDGGHVVALRDGCGEIRFLMDGDKPTEPSGLWGIMGGTEDTRSQVVFPAGTTLYWIDGTPAGVTTQDHGYEPAQVYGDAMRCVDHEIINTMRALPPLTVPLCVRPDDVVTP